MSERFKERYRIPSTRLQNWNYGWNSIYFITLCTASHEHQFGKITDGVMHLSEIGLLANKYWYEIPQHFKFIELDTFVVMPNHIHGILIINKQDDGRYELDQEQGSRTVETRHCLVSMRPAYHSTTSLDPNRIISPGQKRFRNPGSNNISSIIGSYKSVVSKHAHYIYSGFDWQARFYDHIVHSDRSFERIRHYIITNAANWNKDKYYSYGWILRYTAPDRRLQYILDFTRQL